MFTQERLGWATAEVGLVFSAFGLGSILLGPVLANLADRRGRRDVAILGAGLVLLFPIVFVAEAPRPILYLVSVLGGAGVTALEASYFALLADATDGGRRGRAYGWISALSSLGIVVGATGGVAALGPDGRRRPGTADDRRVPRPGRRVPARSIRAIGRLRHRPSHHPAGDIRYVPS